MDTLVSKLRKDCPGLTFVAGPRACWSPQKQRITYSKDEGTEAAWTLLHEVSHALLNHNSYASDLHLVRKEVEAWELAYSLAKKYNVAAIQEAHVERCLDTYRDWLHKRSRCPTCNNHGVQTSSLDYQCVNCQSVWSVTAARFCRPYRLQAKARVT